jgi:DNA-directed RNA polymerase specialized sigma24 family protein
LSNIYIYRVFSIVFKLVPIKDEAIKISAETFLVTWRNITKIESLKQFKKRLEQVAVLRCVDYLNNNKVKPLDSKELTKLGEQFRNPISEIEKDIISLSTAERVVVVLSDQLGLTAVKISRIYNGVQKKEIPAILNKTRKQLIITRPSEFFFKYTEDDWTQLYSYIKKIEKFSILDLSLEEEDVITEYYEYSKELMQDLFMSILPNQEIKDILHNFILDENISAAVKEVQVIAETDVIKTEKLIKKHTQKDYSRFNVNKSTKVVLFLILLLAISYAVSTVIKLPTTWNISSEFIHTNVNGSNAKISELIAGDIIKTEKRKTTIENSENTTITLYENTDFKVNEISGSENVFELKTGGIKLNTENSSVERFIRDGIKYKIKNSFSNIDTRNAQFTFKYVDFNSAHLDVKYGWTKLEIIADKSNAYCVSGYVVNFNTSSAITIPYKKSSSRRFIDAVEQLSKFIDDDDAFNYIVRNSKEEDALTLWHLLSITDAYKRKMLIDRLDELLLLNLSTETQSGTVVREDAKQKLLQFIRSTLLMRY